MARKLSALDLICDAEQADTWNTTKNEFSVSTSGFDDLAYTIDTKVPAEQFIEDFDYCKSKKNSKYIFKDFLEKIFTNEKTPTKNAVQLTQSDLRNSIFKNLKINEIFLKEEAGIGFELNHLKPFYYLIKNTNNEVNQDQKAQLILLLHMSKGNFDKTTFSIIFKSIGSIHIMDDFASFRILLEMKEFFETLIKNKYVSELIESVVKEISDKDSAYNISDTKLSYYDSDINEINGYAGLSEVYVNINVFSRINGFYEFRKNSNSDRLIACKLYFFRLIINEMSHVALRFTIKDFNMSTPKLVESNTNDLKSAIRFKEAGLVAELELEDRKLFFEFLSKII